MYLRSIFFWTILVVSNGVKALTSRRAMLIRGGSTREATKDDAFRLLSAVLKPRIDGSDSKSLQKALQALSSAQKAFKGLDGAAHEAYQRTHSSSDQELTTVAGRARRSATRTASTADAFLSAELCELIEQEKDIREMINKDGALENREVLLQTTVRLTKSSNATVLVLWEPSYSGGAGIDHGSIKALTGATSKKNRGRLLVVIKDSVNDNLKATIDILDSEPWEVELKSGLIANEIASVQLHLYRCAGRVLDELHPILLGVKLVNQTEAAFHFSGQSLGGGVASLAAVILDGSLPMPQEKKLKRRQGLVGMGGNNTNATLDGFGQGRSSATVLGSPPCLSANVKAAFVKSILYGDDVVCRTTQMSLQRLCQRVRRIVKGGLIGRHIGWMADAASLTISSMKEHARGSEGEEGRLVIPGQTFLIRPRRLGGVCSMHEVGGVKGGREALRASVLWQLNDVLLSKSLWKHHQLESYIEGLDKVQLRGVGNIE